MKSLELNSPLVLFFDVNETLLNLQPLEESVDAVLFENGASKLWFATMLQYSLASTVSGQYFPLGDIGAATLRMMARKRDVMISEEEAKAALLPIRTLPPHSDVRHALERLKEAGFRLATLTNSSMAVAVKQMESASLTDLFERQLSVEGVGKFKPHQDVYHWAASEMKVAPKDCMLVAVHPWDVAGAAWAGMLTAFIERSGNRPFLLAPTPDVNASDLHGLCEQLTSMRRAAV